MGNGIMGVRNREGDFDDHGDRGDSQNMMNEENDMMGDISTTILTCKVITEPKLNRTHKNSIAVVDFRVSYRDDNKIEHRLTIKAWNKLAEMVEKVVVPDMNICVIGTLSQERWMSKKTNTQMQKMVLNAINISVPLMLSDAVIEAEDAVFNEDEDEE